MKEDEMFGRYCQTCGFKELCKREGAICGGGTIDAIYNDVYEFIDPW